MKRSFIRRTGLVSKGLVTLLCLLLGSSVFAQLSGTYNVGATGAYTTITDAVAAYNTSTLLGPVTFVLTDATYPAETFPIVINNNADASATNTLTILPASGVAASVTGTSSSVTLFKLLNARYITINGLNAGGSSLAITNVNTGASSAIWLASTSGTGPGCSNIVLQNMTITGGSNTTASDWGILAGVDGVTPSTTGGMDQDNVTIQNNTFLKCGYGIYAKGTAAVSAGGLDNWSITSNTIGPAASGTNNIGYNGIFLASALNPTIAANTIQFIGATATSQVVGINLNASVNGATITQNNIHEVSASASVSGTNANTGMYFGTNAINATVDRNYVTSVSNPSTGGWGARGIIVNTGNTASNITFSNNMVSDVWCVADASFLYNPVGIDIDGTSGGINLYFNSVNLFGAHTGYSSGATHAAAVYMNSTGGNINIRDNVFVNSYDNTTSSTDKSYTVYSTAAATAYSGMDYNDYYVYAPTGVLAYLGADLTTLSAILGAFGSNVSSINIPPVFVAPADLHLQVAGGNAALVAGLPITSITTDIDGGTRSATTPVMGAHEVLLPSCTSVTAGTITPATASFCGSGSTVLTLSGSTAGLGINYQWKSSADSAGWVAIPGATTNSYTTPTITATTYYRVVLVCSFSGVTDSASGSVVIHPLPVIAVSPDGGGICTGAIGLTMTASGASSYSWSPSTGLSAVYGATVTANPTIPTSYTVTGTDGFGCVNTHASMVNVTITPTPVVIAPATAFICPGTSQLLSATSIVTGPGTALAQNFNSGLGAWTIDNTGTTSAYPDVTWTVHPDGYTNELGTYHSPDNSAFILTNSDTAGSGVTVHTIITSPSFSLAGYTVATLTFQHHYHYYFSGDVSASVEVSADGGATWALINNYVTGGTTVGSLTAFAPASFDLTAYLGMTNLMIRFNYQSVFGYDWEIDNIAVSGTVNIPVTDITWAPGTGLYNDAALTAPYTGGASASVYAAPSASATYVATATNGACTSTGTASITVNPLPVAGTITGPSSVCVGSSITFTDVTSGGVWSAGNTHASVSVTGMATGVSAGVDTISYTVTNSCGTATAIKVISVNPTPVAGSITGAATVCVGATTTLTDAAPGGIWSSSTSAASVSSSGAVTGTSAGVAVISYTVTNVCGTAVAVKSITVNPLPAPGVITGPSGVCVGSTITLNDTSAGGTWSSTTPSASIAGGVVTGIVAGTSVISYTVANSCGIAAATQLVSVNPLPAAYTVTGGGTYCEGGSGVPLGLSGSEMGISYQVSIDGVALSYALAGSDAPLDFGSQTTAGTYTIAALNAATGCSSSMLGSAVVVINPSTSPSVSITTGMGDTICSGTPVVFTAVPVNGGATPAYTWSINGVAVSTSSVYTYTPSNGDVVSVTITSSTCAMPDTASNTIIITVVSIAAPAVSITSGTGSDSACAGYPVTYTAVPVNGGYSSSYRWTLNGVNVATGPTFTFTPSNGDLLYVMLNSSLPCVLPDSVNSATHTIHTISLVAPTITIVAHPGLTIPAGSVDTLVAVVAHAGASPSYQWKINGSAIAGATNSTFISSTLANGDIVSCYVTSGGLCSGLTTYSSVTIHWVGTGVNTISQQYGAVTIAPNPNNGTFSIIGSLASADNTDVSLEITDMLGQVIYTGKIEAQSARIQTTVALDNTLANGVYILRLSAGMEQYTIHFVIQH